jgi:DNA-binding NarL/FixJ family response regulator
MRRVNVLIADDHTIVKDGLASLLEAAMGATGLHPCRARRGSRPTAAMLDTTRAHGWRLPAP